MSKGLDPNIQPEKHVIKPKVDTKTKEISQIKPRLGPGRTGLRCKIKTPILIYKPIVQAMESPPKCLEPKSPKVQDTVIPIPSYTTPQKKHRGDASSRETIENVSKEIPSTLIQFIEPPPKPVKISIPKIPGSLSDIDPELNTDFEENFPFQEGVILETYQRLDKLYF